MSGLFGSHIPPPDLLEFPPHFSPLSIMSADRPSSTAPSAAARAAAPLPTITTSNSWSNPATIHLPDIRTLLSGYTLIMSRSPRRSTRGPAVAAENRAALLDAAKRLFAARGFDVPLSAIAREAGVGQGVLYRHFPTRLELAFAVFEGHFQQYAALAQDEGPEAFGTLWRARIDNLIGEPSAEPVIVVMVIAARTGGRDYDVSGRLQVWWTAPLRRASDAALCEHGPTVVDVILAVRMAYAINRTSDTESETGALRDRI